MAIQTLPPFSFLALLLLFSFFSLQTRISIASDTLTPGESLSGNQTIMSKAGKFELGFFQTGNSTAPKYYIGIWYRKTLPQRTVVWVANRERPVPNTSFELKILESGNLVLLGDSKFPLWSSNSTSGKSNSTVAVLLDTGNLVLRDASNSSNVIWESFEHPTNTWLPGGKLGLNKITGESQVLSSWKNSEDPSPGIFSLEIDPDGSSQYYIYWNRSRRYWTSGIWNGQIFSLVPEMTARYLYNFSYVSNDQENYFTYSVEDSSILSRLVMDFSGQIQQLTWLERYQQWTLLWTRPNDRCEAFSLCGPFGICNQAVPFCRCLHGFEPRSKRDWNLSDWSSGCTRQTHLQCENDALGGGEKDRFLEMSIVKFPDNQISLAARSAEQCELACLNSCSCSAYAYSNRCSIWNGNLLNLKQLPDGTGNGSVLYIRLAASALPFSSGSKGTVAGIVAGAVGAVLILFCLIVVLIWRCRRRRLIQASKASQGSLISFTYRELHDATKNFTEKLGSGGFGSVFRGMLPDSSMVAVKKLERIGQGEKQFRTEVSTLGMIQHVNLVRLRGFCSEGLKRLLVYEYMPNGSLDFHLFQSTTDTLDWTTRYKIAIGTARGLAYLHEKCRDCIIHCDIKPENILLDDGFYPKVADFGLAKLMGREFSRALTTMRGTRGYLAPEWLSGQAITPKADVYSYGMMLFEIISGKRNVEQSEDGKLSFFPTWAANKITKGDVLSLLDDRLDGNADMEELSRACRVACWCIQDDDNHRPTMGLVVQIMEGVSDVNVPPIPRILTIFAQNLERLVSDSKSSSDQNEQLQWTSSTSDQTQSESSSSFKLPIMDPSMVIMTAPYPVEMFAKGQPQVSSCANNVG